MTQSLQGKSVIVTGASKGIGKGIARVFARDGGAKVLIVSRNLKEAEATAKEIGHGASGFAADVTKPAEMAAMAKAAVDRHGGLDVLCANAGMFPQVKLEDMTEAQWDETQATNLKGTFLAVQACVPYLKKSDQGRVVITLVDHRPGDRFPWLGALRRHQSRAARLHAHRLHRAGEVWDHCQRSSARQHHHRRLG